jgi:RNA polymerase-binding transcription factor DksA
MTNHSATKAKLETRLTELESRQDTLRLDLAQPLDRDMTEQAIEVEDDASLEGQAMLVAKEIAAVKQALRRIDNGSFGICVSCGGKISAARIAARPEAALCIDCAQRE